jgi:hypothetical protein
MTNPSPNANAQDATWTTLFREIAALGGVADGSPYDLGYSTALNLVLAILECRGFTEEADAHSSTREAPMACLHDLDWSLPIEAVHILRGVRAVKVAQMNAGVSLGNNHWLSTVDNQRLDSSPGAIAGFWASNSGAVPAYPGWRVRNVADKQS